MKNTTVSNHSNAVYQGILAAGFKSDQGQFPLVNDLGVNINDLLTTIGFLQTVEYSGKKSWVTFRNPECDFYISYRNPEESKPLFATLSMNNQSV